VAGSDAILEWADKRRAFEAPPLYPAAQAKAVRAWESWADEVVAPVVRREAYRQLYEDPAPYAEADFPAPRLARPLVLRVLKYYKARRFDETDPDDVRNSIPNIAGRLRATGSGYLFGDQCTAADIATAAFLEPLVPLGEARGYARTPGWSHITRFVERVRPTGTSCASVQRMRARDLRALPGVSSGGHGEVGPMVGHRVRG